MDRREVLYFGQGRLCKLAESIFTPSGNYALRSVLLGVLLSTPGVLIFGLFAALDPKMSPDTYRLLSTESEIRAAYGSIVLSPLLETLILTVLFLVSSKFNYGANAAFYTSTVVFAWLVHSKRGVFVIPAILAFIFFATQLLCFYQSRGIGPALVGVTLTHIINNAIIFSLNIRMQSFV